MAKMKFETILDAYGAINAIYEVEMQEYSVLNPRHQRQRDAFRARLVKMYEHGFINGYNCALKHTEADDGGER